MKKVIYHPAYFIYRIFGPVSLLCLLWLMGALKSGIGPWKALWVYPLIFITGIALPVVISTTVMRLQGSWDFDWTKRENRVKAMIIFLSCWITTGGLVYVFTNETVFHLYLLALAIGLVLFGVTAICKFKASIHMALAVVVFSAVNLYLQMKFWWLFFLLLPIAWARWVLKKHTWGQLAAGVIIPVVIILLALCFFGWPKVPS